MTSSDQTNEQETTFEQADIPRSRRLRKKLYLGEFAIVGFEFTCKLNEANDSEHDVFFESLKAVVDSRDLCINIDGDDTTLFGFVTSGARYGNATDEDKQAIVKALDDSPLVAESTVGEFVDAYYGL